MTDTPRTPDPDDPDRTPAESDGTPAEAERAPAEAPGGDAPAGGDPVTGGDPLTGGDRVSDGDPLTGGERVGGGDPLTGADPLTGGDPLRDPGAPRWVPPPPPAEDPFRDAPEWPPLDPAAHAPRRLTRSSADRMVAGVAGGLGRHFNVDPLIFRIGFVVMTFAGGFGLLAYLVGLVAIPDEDAARPQRWSLARIVGAGLLTVAACAALTPNWLWGPELPFLVATGVVLYLLVRVVRDEGGSHLARVAARVALGIVLFAIAAAGFAAAAAGSALGGGILISGVVIALGVALVGGAFNGGARWLILPAFVLALPLGVVSAADLDLEGDWGERSFRPATASRVADGYRMGIGHMQVDLRGVDFPAGRTELPLELGVGEMEVAVPDGVCVTYDVEVGVGEVTTIDGINDGGLDLNVEGDAVVPAGVPELHVDANVGMGAVIIGPAFLDGPGPRWRGFEPGFRGFAGQNTACEATA